MVVVSLKILRFSKILLVALSIRHYTSPLVLDENSTCCIFAFCIHALFILLFLLFRLVPHLLCDCTQADVLTFYKEDFVKLKGKRTGRKITSYCPLELGFFPSLLILHVVSLLCLLFVFMHCCTQYRSILKHSHTGARLYTDIFMFCSLLV